MCLCVHVGGWFCLLSGPSLEMGSTDLTRDQCAISTIKHIVIHYISAYVIYVPRTLTGLLIRYTFQESGQ